MKRIVLSSLAARYHEVDGWSLDVLNKYLERGSWAKMNYLPLDDRPYYVLEVGSRVNVDKLFRDFDIELVGRWNDDTGTDQEVLETRNW